MNGDGVLLPFGLRLEARLAQRALHGAYVHPKRVALHVGAHAKALVAHRTLVRLFVAVHEEVIVQVVAARELLRAQWPWTVVQRRLVLVVYLLNVSTHIISTHIPFFHVH